MTDLNRIEAQKRLEQDGVLRGIRAYREAAARSDLADTTPGQVILRDTMPPLIRAIEARQEEARVSAGSRGISAPWCWPILALSAEKQALLTLRSALRVEVAESLTILANTISRALRTEIEFEMWREREQDSAKAAKEAGDTEHRNLFEALKRSARVIDERAFRSWGRKIKLVREQPWPAPVAIHVGTLLALEAVRVCGGWFVLQTVWRKGKSIKEFAITPEAREAIRDIHARAEVCSPTLLPMIVPPAPWRHVPKPAPCPSPTAVNTGADHAPHS